MAAMLTLATMSLARMGCPFEVDRSGRKTWPYSEGSNLYVT
jgi:hypothetical protein